ncbi:MAG: PilZ domain-containing protein, partial [Candidatus Omnitrophica bacterium]|nr:PilZ domain-containing protein [Candidatus Omnitrophota bacterium]
FKYYSNESEAIKSLDEDKESGQNIPDPLRRRFKRIPFKTAIAFKHKFSPEPILFKGEIINLSAEGVFVTTEHVFRAQDLLEVKISLLPKPGLMEVDARVAWVADQELQPKDYPGMGLEFFNITSADQEKIIAFVERHFTHSSS